MRKSIAGKSKKPISPSEGKSKYDDTLYGYGRRSKIGKRGNKKRFRAVLEVTNVVFLNERGKYIRRHLNYRGIFPHEFFNMEIRDPFGPTAAKKKGKFPSYHHQKKKKKKDDHFF